MMRSTLWPWRTCEPSFLEISPAVEMLPVAASYSLSLTRLSFEQATGLTDLLSWLPFSGRARMLATLHATAKHFIALACASAPYASTFFPRYRL
jgi:hypothetical protein